MSGSAERGRSRRPQSRSRSGGRGRGGAAPGAPNRNSSAGATVDGVATRRLAIEALKRIASGGAYANLMLPELLARSELSGEDRRFVTQLVYGTTRMLRACDHLVDRFVLGDTDDQVRAALRIGAYQLAFLRTPPHAAVAATVGAVTGGGRKMVNAVLRRVAEAPVEYPDVATRLSYPDWLVASVTESLGADRAIAALEAMNQPAQTTVRDDGYVQDAASQRVVAAVEAGPGEMVVDLCAAPGGKATGLAATGATVIAGDRRASRVGLVVANVERLGSRVVPLVADGRRPPLADGSADRVLVDAPCSGFGSLRRRPDARWRIEPEAPARLAELQVELVLAGLRLLRPGGTLTYSVCTFGDTEGADVIAAVRRRRPEVTSLPVPDGPWIDEAGIGLLLPTDDGSDGMMLARLQRPTA
ncbi:MAG: transcription antitermination factor NusB [Actinomycetota bacterium]